MFSLKCTPKRTTGIYETLFGYNQRKLPDGNNDTLKLTLTSFIRSLKLAALNIHQLVPARGPHICLLGAYVMQKGVLRNQFFQTIGPFRKTTLVIRKISYIRGNVYLKNRTMNGSNI